MESNVSQLTMEELKEFLLQKGVDEDVVCDFQRSRVSGESLVDHTEEYLNDCARMLPSPGPCT